jgi:hypothetical protein
VGCPREQVGAGPNLPLSRLVIPALAVGEKTRMAELALLIALYAMDGLAVCAAAGLLLLWVWHGVSGSILTSK